jgi:ubiquinone/menaquinone biosynthesis C-methylase UbiE
MALALWLRDAFTPPGKVILEVGIKPGDVVLDFGCGPGAYTLAAAELLGGTGRVYAADVHPLALRMVERKAARRHLRNVTTLCTDCSIGVEDEAVDVVLLYDVLHDAATPDRVLEELHRLLKRGGILSVSDHHMSGEDIMQKIATRGLFDFTERGERTFRFSRVYVRNECGCIHSREAKGWA